jgi:ACS family D-galactonate transporter-like MFS transporter
VLLPVVSALSDGLQQRRFSSRFACGWVACASTVAAGLLTLLLSLSSGSIATILCAVLAFSLCNVIFVLAPCLLAEVTPVRQRGAMLGVNTAITTLAGPIAPATIGMVVDIGANPAVGFRTALLLAGTLVILGGLSGIFLIDPEADGRRDYDDPAATPRSVGDAG